MIQAFLDSYSSVKRKLVLIGGARFLDPRNAELLSRLLAENKEIIQQIPFLPSGSDLIKSAYFNCAFHILPSHVETPGIANLEALAFGKPIVVGDCAPVREYFGNFANYCVSASLNSIKEALIATSDYSSKAMPIKFTEFIQKKYTHQSISKRLMALYE